MELDYSIGFYRLLPLPYKHLNSIEPLWHNVIMLKYKTIGSLLIAICLTGLISCSHSVTIINESGQNSAGTIIFQKSNKLKDIALAIPANSLKKVDLPAPELEGGRYCRIVSLLGKNGKNNRRVKSGENILIPTGSIISIRKDHIFVYTP